MDLVFRRTGFNVARKPIAPKAQSNLLLKSRRRRYICRGLNLSIKQDRIAHLDNDAKKDYRIFDIAYVWELSKIIPIIVVMAYLTGYVVNQSYLESLGVPYLRLINSAFLKSGILVLALFVPAIYSVYIAFDDPTDDIRKSIKYVPIVVNYSISTALVLTYLVTLGSHNDLTLFLKEGPIPKILVVIVATDIILYYFWVTSYAGKGMSFRTKSIVFILPAVAIFICVLLAGPPASKTLFKLLCTASLITFISLAFYGDRTLTTGAPLLAFILFLSACSIFGQHVYPSIPTYFGGSRPYVANLTINAGYATAMTQMGFVVTQSSQIEKVTIVYDDADTYVLKNDRGSHALSKQIFVAISSPKLDQPSRRP